MWFSIKNPASNMVKSASKVIHQVAAMLTVEEKQRVLAAFHARGDWKAVAKNNGIPLTTARRVIETNRAAPLPRGGARAVCIKVSPEILAAFEGYINECCQYTLKQIHFMVLIDFGVCLSTSTISRKLCGMLYTVKNVRIEPATYNNDVNKAKRKVFADTMIAHQDAGDYIVYYDETNYNLYCKRTQGWAKRGKRAVAILPPSKGANLQLQCAVSTTDGLVIHRLQRGSIKMEENAAFAEAVYRAVKSSASYIEHFQDKKIVIVLDNAPAHNQTEARLPQHDDCVLLRLAPYSPMCNPIEGCFSVLKAEVKAFLAERRTEMMSTGNFATLTEARMSLLERAAVACMTPHLVTQQAMHSLRAVLAASRMENMQYGS